jgi:flagellar biosynthesis/type III secretory pathway M-ring protein FliF/YscJ
MRAQGLRAAAASCPGSACCGCAVPELSDRTVRVRVQAFMVAAVLTVLSLLAAICYLFPVVREYERKQREEDAATLGSSKREDNPAVEDYKQNYLRGGDYRRGGAGEF